MIGTCCLCKKAIRTFGPGGMGTAPDYVEIGLKMNVSNYHVTPFCRGCVPTITPADYPAILANIRATFEHAWALNHVPEYIRGVERASQEQWEILGVHGA